MRSAAKLRSLSGILFLIALLTPEGPSALAGSLQWTTLGTWTNGIVHSLQVLGNTLYAGGTFGGLGGVSANCVAQWNGTNWSAVGSGVGANVWAMTTYKNMLYAAGNFTNAGAVGVNYIARWDGASWSPLGAGLNDAPLALAASENFLYVGGAFTEAGGVPASYVAQWDGTNWSAIGTGVAEDVLSLAVSGNMLYAGDSDGNVWAWNGISWTSLNIQGGALISSVSVWNGTIYAGGDLSGFRGPPYTCEVLWNGNQWAAVGNALMSGAGSVMSFASVIVDNNFYIGGNFTQTSPSPGRPGWSNIYYVAQLTGTNWAAVGSGPPGPAWSMAASGNVLYAGGSAAVGSPYGAYVARVPLSVPLSIFTNNADFGFNSGAFGFDVLGPFGSNVVIQASTDLQTWTPLQTNLIGIGLVNFRDSQYPSNTQRFYRTVFSP